MKKWVKQWLGPAGASAGEGGNTFPWVALAEVDQLEFIGQQTGEGLHVVFKHSTRCGLSAMMLRRFERVWSQEGPETTFYLLDILRHRGLSEVLAEQSQLRHQSPQVLLFKAGRLVGSASHGDISGLRPEDFRP